MKKWGLFLLITLAIIALAKPTEAARWVWVSEDKIDTTYVDVESVSGTPNGPKEAWFKGINFRSDCTSDDAKRMNKCISSYMLFERYYSDKSYCQLQGVYYFTDETYKSEKYSCEPEKIIPDSLGETLWRYLYK